MVDSASNFLWKVKRKIKFYCRQIFGEHIFLESRVCRLFWGYKVEGYNITHRLPHLNDFKFDFNTVIGKCLFYTGSFELSEIQYFSGVLRKLDEHPVVLDIGANIGVHCISWAKAHENAIVYAFEPSESSMAMLRSNIDSNLLKSRVIPIQKAVSNASGEADFYICSDNAFSGLKDTKRVEVLETQVVPVTTIDSFIEKNTIEKVTFIKIDVEGFETEVVGGGRKTLERFRPDLFIEIYGGTDANPSPEKTIMLLQDMGYSAYVFSDGVMYPYKAHSDSLYNYYFTMNALD